MTGIFDRADELIRELAEEYRRCLATQVVTERAKNLFHEVMIKLRSSLDMTMFRVWEKYGKPNFSEAKVTAAARRVHFPISDDQNAFRKRLDDLGLSSLAQTNKCVYEAIERAQPWSTNRHDLRHLRDLANLAKHVRLVPQVAESQLARKVAGPQGSVVYTAGVKFHMERIVGAPIDPDTHEPIPTEDVTVRHVNLVTFVVEGYNIMDPLIFCISMCQGARRLVERLMDCLQDSNSLQGGLMPTVSA